MTMADIPIPRLKRRFRVTASDTRTVAALIPWRYNSRARLVDEPSLGVYGFQDSGGTGQSGAGLSEIATYTQLLLAFTTVEEDGTQETDLPGPASRLSDQSVESWIRFQPEGQESYIEWTISRVTSFDFRPGHFLNDDYLRVQTMTCLLYTSPSPRDS